MSFKVYRSGLGNEYVYEGGKAINFVHVRGSRSYENIVAKLATRSFLYSQILYSINSHSIYMLCCINERETHILAA